MSFSMSTEMMLRVHEEAQRAYPRECCGALIGIIDNGRKQAFRVAAMHNAELEAPERRFVIDSRALMLLERSAAAEGVAVVGFYHSHPDCPALPSATDLAMAWPVYSYVIVSVVGGKPVDVRSYILEDSGVEAARFVEEQLELLP